MRLLGDILRDMGLVSDGTDDELTRQAQDIAKRGPYPADEIRHGLALGLTVAEVEACLAHASMSGVDATSFMSTMAKEKSR